MLRVELLVVIATCFYVAVARSSPQARKIQGLIKNIDTRYSDDIYEDANLDVPALITKYGYPVEEHSVTTEDGYILGMHRIPYGRDANNVANQNKPVVFVMHGLLCSSADFILMGPGSGLGYILAEEGFDVWLGNSRGNYYSRKHVTLNPDAILNTAFWQFSYDDIGNEDLPAMIDYILKTTGAEKLHYVGHSQGTTSYFVMGAMRPEYNDKIISMHALAPVAYMAHNENLLLKALAPYSSEIETIASIVGVGEFMPHSIIFTWAGEALCRDEVVFQPICSNILFLIGGWDEAQLNTTMMPVIFGHTPAGASVKQLAHYGQGIAAKGFRRYDYGTNLANYLHYGSFTPPSYDLSKVTSPVYLHYSTGDPLAEVADVETLYSELGNPMGMYLVPLEKFSHVDYMYGINAKELVYDGVINIMKSLSANS